MATQSSQDYPSFVYDSTKHKDFKHASRHVLGDALKGDSSLPTLTLSSKEVEALSTGLGSFDMDYRWAGNASASNANKRDEEVVVRLYRTWTSSLIFEARYRPQGKEKLLTLYEFAFESDKKVYQSTDLKHELGEYGVVLQVCILALILQRQPSKGLTN